MKKILLYITIVLSYSKTFSQDYPDIIVLPDVVVTGGLSDLVSPFPFFYSSYDQTLDNGIAVSVTNYFSQHYPPPTPINPPSGETTHTTALQKQILDALNKTFGSGVLKPIAGVEAAPRSILDKLKFGEPAPLINFRGSYAFGLGAMDNWDKLSITGNIGPQNMVLEYSNNPNNPSGMVRFENGITRALGLGFFENSMMQYNWNEADGINGILAGLNIDPANSKTKDKTKLSVLATYNPVTDRYSVNLDLPLKDWGGGNLHQYLQANYGFRQNNNGVTEGVSVSWTTWIAESQTYNALVVSRTGGNYFFDAGTNPSHQGFWIGDYWGTRGLFQNFNIEANFTYNTVSNEFRAEQKIEFEIKQDPVDRGGRYNAPGAYAKWSVNTSTNFNNDTKVMALFNAGF